MTLVWASGYNGITDPDAQTYIAAVEAADGQAIENDVALAINDFVVGCKDDGIWDAIKASCILAGARTLDGALVPLKGTAPTNYNFVAGDYNRETGLVGTPAVSYLDSGLDMQDVPADSIHQSVYVTSAGTNTASYIGGVYLNNGAYLTEIQRTSTSLTFRNRKTTGFIATGNQDSTGFLGTSRGDSTQFEYRLNGSTGTQAATLGNPPNGDFSVFRRTNHTRTNARLSFYSIGESIDLEKLDNRVSTLMTDIGAAIP
jgi:hypothetical protein